MGIRVFLEAGRETWGAGAMHGWGWHPGLLGWQEAVLGRAQGASQPEWDAEAMLLPQRGASSATSLCSRARRARAQRARAPWAARAAGCGVRLGARPASSGAPLGLPASPPPRPGHSRVPAPASTAFHPAHRQTGRRHQSGYETHSIDFGILAAAARFLERHRVPDKKPQAQHVGSRRLLFPEKSS